MECDSKASPCLSGRRFKYSSNTISKRFQRTTPIQKAQISSSKRGLSDRRGWRRTLRHRRPVGQLRRQLSRYYLTSVVLRVGSFKSWRRCSAQDAKGDVAVNRPCSWQLECCCFPIAAANERFAATLVVIRVQVLDNTPIIFWSHTKIEVQSKEEFKL